MPINTTDLLLLLAAKMKDTIEKSMQKMQEDREEAMNRARIAQEQTNIANERVENVNNTFSDIVYLHEIFPK